MDFLWKNLIYFPERIGFYHAATDEAFIMDDYGNAVHVPFSFGSWFYSEE